MQQQRGSCDLQMMVRSADLLRVAAKLLTLLVGRATHALDNGLGQASPIDGVEQLDE